MATRQWTGAATAIKQVSHWTFGGTWVTADVITVTCGNADMTITVGSLVTPTQVAETVKQALLSEAFTDTTATVQPSDGGSVWPYLVDCVVTRPTFLTLTGVEAGVPFTITITENSTLGTITPNSPADTACTGPNFADNADNYKDTAGASGLPAGADTLVISGNTPDILYGLSALAAVTGALQIEASYTGKIGLLAYNKVGQYQEYRPLWFQTASTQIQVGTGQGNGSSRINLDAGAANPVLSVERLGTPEAGEVAALRFKTTGSTAVVNQYSGRIWLGDILPSTTVQILTVNLMDKPELPEPYCFINRILALGNLNINRGSTETLQGWDAGCVVKGKGKASFKAHASFSTQATSATLYDDGVVAITGPALLAGTYRLANRSTLDLSGDNTVRTISNPVEVSSDESAILDPHKSIPAIIVDFNFCQPSSRNDWGRDLRLTRGATA